MKTKNILILICLVTHYFISFSQKNIDVLLINKDYEKALAEIEKEIIKNPTAEIFLKK